MIDYYDPALMFTIPRLAIVCGLIIYPEGPLNPDQTPGDISELFRPFQSLLNRVRSVVTAHFISLPVEYTMVAQH